MQVCFGCSLHEVALYRYTGLHECSQGECDATPAIKHNMHFSRCAKAINCSAFSAIIYIELSGVKNRLHNILLITWLEMQILQLGIPGSSVAGQ